MVLHTCEQHSFVWMGYVRYVNTYILQWLHGIIRVCALKLCAPKESDDKKKKKAPQARSKREANAINTRASPFCTSTCAFRGNLRANAENAATAC